jgi:ActR/RegA family two-component response regulator
MHHTDSSNIRSQKRATMKRKNMSEEIITRMKKEEKENKKKIKENIMEFQHWIWEHIHNHWTQRWHRDAI